MELATAEGGGAAVQLSEAELLQLAEAEKVAEQLRQKEAELKKRHLDSINAFLLVCDAQHSEHCCSQYAAAFAPLLNKAHFHMRLCACLCNCCSTLLRLCRKCALCIQCVGLLLDQLTWHI
jgi:hypothetical protein